MSQQQFKRAWTQAKSKSAIGAFDQALAAGVPVLVMPENDDSEDKRFKRSRIAKSYPSCLRDSKAGAVILQNLSTRLVGRITTDYQDPRTMRLNGRINHHIRNNNHD